MINGLKFNVTKYLKLCPIISTYIFTFQLFLWFLENYIPTLFLLFCSIFSCSFIVTWHDKQSIYLVQNIQVIYFYSCQVISIQGPSKFKPWRICLFSNDSLACCSCQNIRMILFVLISQDVQVQFRYIPMHIIYVPKCNTPWEMSKDGYHNPTSE